MAAAEPWDLVVIGGGSAGLIAATTAAGLGASVLLVERHRLGGDCLWTGCVPSKALIAAARRERPHDAAGPAAEHLAGHDAASRDARFAAAMTAVRAAIAAIEPHDAAPTLERSGVAVRMGEARFTSARSLDVGGQEVRFRRAIVATGASPRPLRVDGADEVRIRTSDDLWELERLPERLVIVGGGPVGCELGQAMARLGARVTIVHRGERLLSKEDAVASGIVADALRADGVELRLGRAATAVRSHDGTAGELVLDDGEALPFDALLAAVGRESRPAALVLDAAGVRTDATGSIVVDAALRTSAPGIWAAGEVAGLPRYTHTAGVSGSVAATNAVLGLRRAFDAARTPRVTFTAPEVASIGVQPEGVDPRRHRVLEQLHADTDRAIADGETSGSTRIVVDRRGRILGGTIVGPRAGETMGELALAVQAGLTTTDLTAATHPYPTYSDALWNAAIDDVRHRLGRGAPAAAIRMLRGLAARRGR